MTPVRSTGSVWSASIAVLLLSLLMLTFPGIVPFNRIDPRILGIPFNLIWIATWVVMGGFAFWLAERTKRR